MYRQDEYTPLNTEEITDAVIKYIEEDYYKYSIMIDGEWGTGKTYLVNEVLVKKIGELKNEAKEKKKVCYLSLYGMNDANYLDEQII